MQDWPASLGFGEEVYREPSHLAAPHAWEGHIPFVQWLVAAIRPGVTVELGTFSGNSYFAMCESISLALNGGKAFAVDTWKGDEHAGFYGEDVFASVRAVNDARFSSFSTLMRMLFDEARAYFPDNSVDLLHIDGLHTYDAVLHDFETWHSAMSDRGIVLFHDINVREREFGVWQLWAELSKRFPSFAFDHCNGLGVLAVGSDTPPPLRALCELGRDPEASGQLRRFFSRVGASITRRLRLDEAEARLQAIAASPPPPPDPDPFAAEIHAWSEEARRWSAEALSRADALSRAKDVVIGQLQEQVQARDAMLGTYTREIDERDRRLVDGQDRLEEERRYAAGVIEGERGRLAAERAVWRHRLDRTVQQMLRVDSAYRTSASWRLTAPIRAISGLRSGNASPVVDFLADLSRETGAELPTEPMEIANDSPATHVTALDADTRRSARDAAFDIRAARLNAFLFADDRIVFAEEKQPDVSVIVVVHNAAALLFGCLTSLRETQVAGGIRFEIVLVDNGSTDATGALLSQVDGIRLLNSTANLHYLRAVNLAAASARGRHLLLLNSDAELLPGALAAGVVRLDADPSIGALGGRVILPDGTLQEAGSIIWRDGTCLGYARGLAPDDPEVLFRRDVDYCSGACLFTPRALFERLGGLDERYVPAYYEETDYCVRVHQAGLRVCFDPDVAVLHIEFGSAEATQDALSLQTRNHKVFRERNALWLADQPSVVPGHAATRAASARLLPGTRRVLMVEDRLPKPELGAGYPRAEHIVAELVAAGATVTFFPMFRHAEDWKGARRVLGPEVRFEIDGAADRLRPFLERTRSQFDAILVCRPHNMRAFLDAVGPDRDLLEGATLIYDAEAVFEGRKLQELALQGTVVDPADAKTRIAEEVALVRTADVVTSVSGAEVALFRRHGARDVRLLGHALDAAPTPSGFADRDGIVFLGSIHDDNAPNADSLRHFASEILPKLRRTLDRPELRLRVVGLNRARTIAAMDGIDIDLVGMVADPAVELDRARVFVVPTRFAAGIPHKLHQAVAMGIPVVATRLIADQLGWEDGHELLVADDATGFAAACARLHEDPALWEHIRKRALERLEAECSPARFRAELRTLLADVPIRTMRTPLGGVPGSAAEELPRYAGRGEADDFALAVPFAYPAPLRSPPESIAVICHVFHLDLFDEIRSYLANIPWPYELVVTTDTEAKRDAIEAAFAHSSGRPPTVRVTPNRGRDLGPMLVACGDVLRHVTYVLHLHTKKSLHAAFLAPWRQFLFETLIGSPTIVRSVFECFEHLPRVGLLFPQHFDPVRRWVSWGGNFAAAASLAERMGFGLDPGHALDFPSGSMFWARTAALRPLLDLDLSFDEFPDESAQLDHTITHAIERVLVHACERSGHDWLKIADPALHVDSRRILRVASPEELVRFDALHRVSLLGGASPPPAAELPPMITMIPPGLAARLRPPDREAVQRLA